MPAPFRRNVRLTRLVACGLIATSALSCTVKEAVAPVEPTPFIENPDLLQTPETTPFDLAWMSPAFRSWQYDTVVIGAVRVNQVDARNWIYSTSTLIPTEGMYLERVNDIATYIQQAVSSAFAEYEPEGLRSKVIEGAPQIPLPPTPSSIPLPIASPTPDPLDPIRRQNRTMRIELSISQIDFGDPLIYGSMLALPIPAAANLSTAVKSPSITLEARFVDEKTREVIGELVDRRFPQVKPIDVNRLTITSAIRELSDSFAQDLVESYYRKPGEEVSSRFPFSLLPW